MQFLKLNIRMKNALRRERILYSTLINIMAVDHAFNCQSTGLLWCFITCNLLLYNKQHQWRVKGNMQTDFHGKDKKRSAKKHFHIQIRGVRGVSWDRKTWNSTQLDQAWRNVAAIFESLYEQGEMEAITTILSYPNLCKLCFQWVESLKTSLKAKNRELRHRNPSFTIFQLWLRVFCPWMGRFSFFALQCLLVVEVKKW